MCLLPGELNSLAVPGVSSPSTLARCTSTASDSDEDLNSLLEELNSLLDELNSLGEVLVLRGHLQVPSRSLVILAAPVSTASRLLGVSSLAVMEVLSISTPVRCVVTASGSNEELDSLLERLDPPLKELHPLGEVLDLLESF